MSYARVELNDSGWVCEALNRLDSRRKILEFFIYTQTCSTGLGIQRGIGGVECFG
jgi:hypothetical protein